MQAQSLVIWHSTAKPLRRGNALSSKWQHPTTAESECIFLDK